MRVAIVAALGVWGSRSTSSFTSVSARCVSAVARVGFGGFALLCLYGLAMSPLLAAAWIVLLPAGRRLFRRFPLGAAGARGRRRRLPFSQIGGIALGARAAILHGVAAPLAFASTIVDVTTRAARANRLHRARARHSEHARPATPLSASLGKFVLIGLALAVFAGAVLLALQRYGHRLTDRSPRVCYRGPRRRRAPSVRARCHSRFARAGGALLRHASCSAGSRAGREPGSRSASWGRTSILAVIAIEARRRGEQRGRARAERTRAFRKRPTPCSHRSSGSDRVRARGFVAEAGPGHRARRARPR